MLAASLHPPHCGCGVGAERRRVGPGVCALQAALIMGLAVARMRRLVCPAGLFLSLLLSARRRACVSNELGKSEVCLCPPLPCGMFVCCGPSVACWGISGTHEMPRCPSQALSLVCFSRVVRNCRAFLAHVMGRSGAGVLWS